MKRETDRVIEGLNVKKKREKDRQTNRKRDRETERQRDRDRER